MDAAASRPGVETLQGRGAVRVVPAPAGAGRWVVRHYHRGGGMAFLGDRYLRMGEPRPSREFRLGRRLEEMGVPTVRHVGAATYPAGLWYRGDLVTELVAGSRDLAAIVFGEDGEDDGRAAAAMSAAGALVRTLHDRGVVHRDLNIKNILIEEGEAAGEGGVRARILDLDRASVGERVGEGARRRMLERFWRSVRKWEARTGLSMAAGPRQAFEGAYRGPGNTIRG